MTTPTKIIPSSTLTPSAIAAIEADASSRYGIRLRHVPDAQVEPDKKAELGAKKAPTNKPTPSKGSKPLTFEQASKLVVAKLKKQAQAKADSLVQALGSSKVWERHRPRLLADKVIVVAQGKGRAMIYELGTGEE